jgi:hypothetical protein
MTTSEESLCLFAQNTAQAMRNVAINSHQYSWQDATDMLLTAANITDALLLLIEDLRGQIRASNSE